MHGLEVHSLTHNNNIYQKLDYVENVEVPLNIFDADQNEKKNENIKTFEVVTPTNIGVITGGIFVEKFKKIPDFRYLKKIPSSPF